MDDKTIELVSKLIAIVGGLFAVFIGISSFRKNTRERKLDLKWKQANAAKDFINEIHDDEAAGAAIAMLDWFVIDKSNFEELKFKEIKYEEVLEALPKIKTKVFDKKEHYILECFDWFFYFIDRTEQHINNGLFDFENVKYVFYPYYKKIKAHKDRYDLFMRERCYLLAPEFWKRFENETVFTKWETC